MAEPEDTTETFDLTRVRDLLTARVEGIGRAVGTDLADSSLSLLLVPDDADAEPIHVRGVADVCRIRFGCGTRLSQGWGDEGDEDVVLDLVDAIIRGDAWERGYVGEDGQLELFAEIRGERVHSRSGHDVDHTFVRRVPAWRS